MAVLTVITDNRLDRREAVDEVKREIKTLRGQVEHVEEVVGIPTTNP